MKQRLLSNKTIFLEAMELRDRRDVLRSKLNDMLLLSRERRLSSLLMGDNSSSSGDKPSLMIRSDRDNVMMKQYHRYDNIKDGKDALSLWKGNDPPVSLPYRRKTHWDVVLEEMKWMATDFIEERKWKSSTSKMIGIEACQATRDRWNQKTMEAIAISLYQPTMPTTTATTTTAAIPNQTQDGNNNNPITKSDIMATTATGATAQKKWSPWSYGEMDAEVDIYARGIAKTAAGFITDLITDCHHLHHENATTEDNTFPLTSSCFERFIPRLRRPRHHHVDRNTQYYSGGSDYVEELIIPINSAMEEEHVDDDDVIATKDVTVVIPDSDAALSSWIPSSYGSYMVSNNNINSRTIMTKEQFYESITKLYGRIIEESKRRMMSPSDHVSHENSNNDQPSAETNNNNNNNNIHERYGVHLLSTQRRIVDCIEFFWNHNNFKIGSIIQGNVSTGKTYITASLLWRHRQKGPQLVICHSASIIRWIHNLSVFSDMRLYVIGNDQHRDSFVDYFAKDVVLCEFQYLPQISPDMLSLYASIILDCRFPSGYSNWNTITTTTAIDTDDDDDNNNHKYYRNAAVPTEYLSSEWWSYLVLGGARSSFARRLILSKRNPVDEVHRYNGLSTREKVDLMSYHILFLYGTSHFSCEAYALEKTVLAWAKYRTKSDKQSTATTTTTKFQRVLKEMITFVEPLICTAFLSEKSDDDAANSICLNEEWIPWEVRRSKMTSEQWQAYESACRNVRSILSKSLSDNENGGVSFSSSSPSHRAISKALIYLRRQCTHANLEDARHYFEKSSKWNKVRKRYHYPHYNQYVSKAAQTNIELAASILRKSSKLHQLIRILVEEYYIPVPDWNHIKSFVFDQLMFDNDTQLNASNVRANRIVVLAALPEIKILASDLLNALGIGHELLLQCPIAGSNQMVSTEMQALNWSRNQLSLSKFNALAPHDNNTTMIIIACLETVAGDHGGICIESADLVICLDEDWSGRCELLMQSLQLRCRIHRNYNPLSPSSRFIRLVADGSCEDIMLINQMSEGVQRVSESTRWRRNTIGVYRFLPDAPTEEMNEYIQHWKNQRPKNLVTLPGWNLLMCRNMELSKFTGSHTSTYHPFSRKKLLFLPTLSNGNDHVTEFHWICSLADEEEKSKSFSLSYIEDFHNNHDISCHRNLVPELPELPVGFIGSFDLPVAPMRLYLEKVNDAIALEDFGIRKSRSNVIIPIDHAKVDPSMVIDSNTYLDSQISYNDTNSAQVASTLLFYNAPSNLLTTTSQRAHLYASSFSSTTNLPIDGNLGCEAHVFFPPLFPGLLECADAAVQSVERLRSLHNQSLNNYDENRGEKRSFPMDTISNKRQRHHSSNSMDLRAPLFTTIVIPPTSFAATSLPTEEEAPSVDAASVLVDLYDDYGIAGIGAIPPPVDSSFSAAIRSVQTNGSLRISSQSNEWFGTVPLCDAEEVESSKRLCELDIGNPSMILFVSGKKSPMHSGLPFVPKTKIHPVGLPSGLSSWKSASDSAQRRLSTSVVPFVAKASNLTERKKRKRSITETTGMPEAHLHDSSFSPISNMDVIKHRVLSSLRQSSAGATILESESFRIATIRVRQRVLDSVVGLNWSSTSKNDKAHGLPLECSQHNMSGVGRFEVDPNLWTSIVKRLKTKDFVTGSEAVDMSRAQAANLRRSLVAPHRTDFGPFQIGFLSMLSGSTATSAAPSRLGISLPMGVKTNITTRDSPKIQWTRDEIESLKGANARFGANWILASLVVSGLDDIRFASPRESLRMMTRRAARSCRDQWNLISRNNSLIEHKQQSGANQEMNESTFTSGMDTVSVDKFQIISLQSPILDTDQPKNLPNTILLSASEGSNCKTQSDKVDNTRKRSFSALRMAKAKQQVIPITIPGIPPGSPATVVASHPSHLQAVQSSISSSWTGGRTEMWPLQLLDASDRHKAGRAAAASPTLSTRPPATSSSSTSNRIAVATSTGNRAPSQPVANNRIASSPIPQGSPPAATNPGYGSAPLPPQHPSTGSPTRNTLANNYIPSAKPIPPTPMTSAAARQQSNRTNNNMDDH